MIIAEVCWILPTNRTISNLIAAHGSIQIRGISSLYIQNVIHNKENMTKKTSISTSYIGMCITILRLTIHTDRVRFECYSSRQMALEIQHKHLEGGS